jgi:hypothetical protein
MGVVTDAVTGNPIAGVAVQLSGQIAVGVLTGPSGQYSIGNIPPGSYSVKFSHPDYETLEV